MVIERSILKFQGRSKGSTIRFLLPNSREPLSFFRIQVFRMEDWIRRRRFLKDHLKLNPVC